MRLICYVTIYLSRFCARKASPFCYVTSTFSRYLTIVKSVHLFIIRDKCTGIFWNWKLSFIEEAQGLRRSFPVFRAWPPRLRSPWSHEKFITKLVAWVSGYQTCRHALLLTQFALGQEWLITTAATYFPLYIISIRYKTRPTYNLL